MAAAGTGTVTLPATRSIPTGSCTVSVDVTSAVGGVYTNTIAANALQTSNGNNAAAATANLTVNTTAPTIAKAFLPTPVNAGTPSTLTITLTNANTSVASLTAVLTDTLPVPVVVAPTPNAATTCSGAGAVTAVAGTGSVTLPATRSIPAAVGATPGSCTVTVDVVSPSGGAFVNTIPANALQTSNGNNAAAASATLAVNSVAPTVAKAFAPNSITANGTSTLTITLNNANASAASLTAALTDTLPSGVVIAATPNASTTCSGAGAPTAVAGSGSVTLPTTRSIPAGSCTVSVDVTSAIGGVYTNTIAANALQTSNGNNAAAATANLTVTTVTPTVAKAFAPSTIAANATSTLTVTLTNANTSAASLTAALTDTLPSGVVIAATPNASTTCSGAGAPTAVAGSSSVTLPATRSIAAAVGVTPGSCTLSVDVTASLGGVYANTIAANALQTSNGNNAAAAAANLTVTTVTPTVAKAFAPSTIAANGVSTLTITLSNANTSVASLSAALTDTLPSGVVIAATPNASTTCAGAGGPTAVAGSGSVTLPATRSIPAGSSATAGSCTVSVDVTAALGGVYTNTIAANALQTSNGSNAAAATANLTVTTVTPTVAKAFAPSTIAANGVSTLTITLSNANTSVASLSAALTDTLPSGVVIAATPNASTTCSGAGVPTAVAGSGSVTLPATRSIPAAVGATPGSCTLSVDVTASLGGVYANTIAANALQTSNGNNAAAATTNLTVTTVTPAVTKAFAPSTIAANGTSTLTVTLTNANTSAANLAAALTDTLPSGVVIAATPNASTTCSGAGAPTAVAGSGSVTLPATRSIPAGSSATAGSCTLSVDVTAALGGVYTNTIAANALQTSNGSNAAAATANLTVTTVTPTVAKAFAPGTIAANATATLTVTLSNANTSAASLSAALTDTCPRLADRRHAERFDHVLRSGRRCGCGGDGDAHAAGHALDPGGQCRDRG